MKTLFLSLVAVLMLFPGAASALRISYTYDAAGRMVAANYNGNSRTSYAYDKNGSLLSRVNTITPPLSPHLAATYTGLITNSSPDVANTGIITLKLLANGTFSGKLTIQGTTLPFSGKFLPSGSLDGGPISIPRKTPLPPYILDINIDTQGSLQAVLGSLSGVGVPASDVSLQADFFNLGGRLIGSGFIGKYTMILEANAGAGVPKGTGYATVSVSNKGIITMAGKLPNDIAITQGSQIVGPNVWPLFVALHANQGFLAGNTVFVNQGGLAIQGSLVWGKPLTNGSFHPADFKTGVNVEGSLYLAPLAGQRALNFPATSPNAQFNAEFGNLLAPIMKNVTLDTANKFTTPVDANSLKLTLTGATGLVSGSFKADANTTRTLKGVLMQGQTFAAGYFTGSTESGDFSILPSP